MELFKETSQRQLEFVYMRQKIEYGTIQKKLHKAGELISLINCHIT